MASLLAATLQRVISASNPILSPRRSRGEVHVDVVLSCPSAGFVKPSLDVNVSLNKTNSRSKHC
jgi:hypothetical protein